MRIHRVKLEDNDPHTIDNLIVRLATTNGQNTDRQNASPIWEEQFPLLSNADTI